MTRRYENVHPLVGIIVTQGNTPDASRALHACSHPYCRLLFTRQTLAEQHERIFHRKPPP